MQNVCLRQINILLLINRDPCYILCVYLVLSISVQVVPKNIM